VNREGKIAPYRGGTRQTAGFAAKGGSIAAFQLLIADGGKTSKRVTSRRKKIRVPQTSASRKEKHRGAETEKEPSRLVPP